MCLYEIDTRMFISSLSISTKLWEQLKCPSMGEWINTLWYIHTMEYYSAIKNKELGRAWWLMPVIPAVREAKVGGSPEVRTLKPAWPTWWNSVSTKNTKISQIQWSTPVISAIREAEAEESLKPRRQRLWGAEIVLLYSSLGNRARHRLK